ncbi:MAG: alpha-galactosidase [Eubacteriales bacterium]
MFTGSKLFKFLLAGILALLSSLGSFVKADMQIYESVDNVSAAISSEELKIADDWFKKNILGVLDGKPAAFDFCYGLKAFNKNLGEWNVSLTKTENLDKKVQYTIELKQKNGNLLVTCEAVNYLVYPACEWTLCFENTGSSDSKILSNIYALNSCFPIGASTEAIKSRLYYSKGGTNTTDAFTPLTKGLLMGIPAKFNPGDGRCSNDFMPFFNLDLNNCGVIFAIGWPGVWEADFNNIVNKNVKVTIGQKTITGALKAGEKIRSPLAAVLFYQAGVMKGQNVFRQWINDCYYVNNQKPILSAGSIEYNLMQYATIDNQIDALNIMLKTKAPIEAFWMDAGWYVNGETWYKGRGTWRLDPVRFPTGLKPLTDLGHANGYEHVLWFEPESVDPGSDLYDKNEYLLVIPGNENKLYNFANDEAADYMMKLIDSKIKEFGLDIYRQDCNINPAQYWDAGVKVTGEKRIGFTENKYAVNFLRFWDYLLANNPGLIIDNCASGGRRICLETIRRSEVLWRCDSCHDATAEQCHTYGLSYWLPLNGSGTLMLRDLSTAEAPNRDKYTDPYAFRSCLSSTLILSWNFSSYESSKETFAQYVGYVNQYMDIRKYFLKDYYPLTPASVVNKNNLAMQYNDPQDSSGIILAFRREDSKTSTLKVALCGLEKNTQYNVINIDTNESTTMLGSMLMDSGLTISIAEQPGAVIYKYSKA